MIHHLPQFLFGIVLLFATLVLASCGGGESSTPPPLPDATAPNFETGSNMAVIISWDPNRETAVNTAGGGYKVYYSTKAGFNITDAGVTEVDVPYVSPPLTPTRISLKIQSGQYYFRVVAYSALNPPGDGWGSTSALSDEASVKVP